MVFGNDSPLEKLARHSPGWRTRIVVLVVALVGATSASIVWHGAHGPDQGCVVCQLRDHTVADLAAAPRLWSLDTPEPVWATAFVEGIVSHPRASVPTRAPPA